MTMNYQIDYVYWVLKLLFLSIGFIDSEWFRSVACSYYEFQSRAGDLEQLETWPRLYLHPIGRSARLSHFQWPSDGLLGSTSWFVFWEHMLVFFGCHDWGCLLCFFFKVFVISEVSFKQMEPKGKFLGASKRSLACRWVMNGNELSKNPFKKTNVTCWYLLGLCDKYWTGLYLDLFHGSFRGSGVFFVLFFFWWGCG